jgi:hypothetical protein
MVSVRWINRVSIDTIHFNSDLPRRLILHQLRRIQQAHHGSKRILGPNRVQFERSDSCLQALLAVAFGDVKRNRLSSSEPVIACWSIYNATREGNVVDRKTIHVKACVIEDWFVYQNPFEYEYRFTEYDYDEDRNA